MTTTLTDRRNGVSEGLAVKAPVRVATTANITLSGLQTIDGVTVEADDRVLVKDQTSAVNNGIWVASTGNWTRAIDFNGARDIVKGTRVYVNEGTVNTRTVWFVSTDDTVLPGTSSITFSQGVAFTGYADYATKAIAEAAQIPAAWPYLLRIAGYTTAGDGGGATYKRVAALPSHAGYIRSTDRFMPDGSTDDTNGGYWEIVEVEPTPKMFGAVADGSVSTASGTGASAAIQDYVDYCATRTVCSLRFEPGAIYYIDAQIDLPLDRDVTVHAHGATFVTDQAIVMFSRMPANQAATGPAIAYAVRWYGGLFYGYQPTSGQYGLQIGATYMSEFQSIAIQNLDYGIDLQFCLKAHIKNCMATNCKTRPFWARSGQWSGASLSNAQSNCTVMSDCRVYHKAGALAAYTIEHASDCAIRDCIAEGANPVNNIEFIVTTSTVVKNLEITNIHFENSPTNAHMLFDLNGGVVTVNNVYASLTPILIDNTGSGTGLIIVRDIGYLQGTMKHETASGCTWFFENIFAWDPTATGSWNASSGYSKPGGNKLYWVGTIGTGLNLGAGGNGQVRVLDRLDFPNNTDIGAGANKPGTISALTAFNVASGSNLTKFITAQANLDFGSIAAGASADLTMTATGATSGNNAFASPAGIEAGLIWSAWVSAANTVTVRMFNLTGSPIDPANRSWRCIVMN